MKKQFCLLLALLLPMMVTANAVEINGICYNLIQKGDSYLAEVTSNPNHYVGNIIIPEVVTYEGFDYDVFAIGEKAFYNEVQVSSISIPKSITSIGSYAFNGCNNLLSVYIYDLEAWLNMNIKSTPLEYALLYLNGEEVNEVVIPDGFTSVPRVFQYYKGLTSVIIPSSVISIDDGAFYNCEGLKSVSMPNNIEYIGNYAFWNCILLESITIPNSVTYIGTDCFMQTNLTSVFIPSGVKQIRLNSFRGCTNLKSVTISEGVEEIASLAFADCTSLESIKIPNSVVTIDWEAFAYCSNLSTISIGSNVKNIKKQAFKQCSSISDVYCYMPTLSSNMHVNAFEDSYIEYATLHVPQQYISLYQYVEPWKNFGSIVAIETPKHTLTYMVDNVIYKSYQVEEGATITAEETPAKEG